MAGLINVGRQTLGQATQGFGAASQLEQSRNAMGRQLDAARNAQRMSMATTGAGLGASIGVNNLMGRMADAELASRVGSMSLPAPTLSAPVNVVSAGSAPLNSTALGANVGSLGTVATPTGPMALAAPASSVAPIAAVETGAAVLPEAIAAQTAAVEAGTVGAGAAGGASTGTMAAIGAVATPLLIGAGAALLLDSLFDIF
jgi:hypothetical protein